ncbi:MAG: tRNA epoxyqueuosine(34) reductase QueG [Ignavibacteria bacterium]|nr:tRNA epoxyqueuosine(34) reductase QueG [Ignavibacteriota bacterium]
MKNNITNIIRQKCIESGFIKVGISMAEELMEEGRYLKLWLEEKMNADMKWMNNTFEKRINPELVMSDVKSVISLAFLYDTPFAHKEDPDIPKISRYAWGEKDYHKVIKKKLKALCAEIEKLQENLKTRAYIDDGPVMDKSWAVRSGIGWMGKHTNVINKDFGSFFFIATILVNTELDYDEPVEDLCRGCSLCVSACPTGAIYEEYSVDANLCISYQTIENRNDIPEEIDLSGWIFGCDICQDVCPFNDNKFFTDNELFFPRKEIFNKNADEFLSWDEDSFNKIFEGTPVRRTKYKGFIRNINKLLK